MSETEPFRATKRSQVRRRPQRASFSRETIYAILDEGLVCHVGFMDEEQVYVIPTAYWRSGDRLYLHGSTASRMLRAVERGASVCVTVTLLDGLVLARSAFHHSMNYRSVVVFGRGAAVTDPEEKRRAMNEFVEHVCPGRSAEVRAPTEKELEATALIAIPLEEASAKLRSGGPIDDEPDYSLPVWAGVLPLRPRAGEPIPDERSDPPLDAPDYLVNYSRPLWDAHAE